MSVPSEAIAAAAASAAKARQKVLASRRTIAEAELEEYEAFNSQLKKLGFTRDDLSADEKAIFEFGGFPQAEPVGGAETISFADAIKLAGAEGMRDSGSDESFRNAPESLTPQQKLFAVGRNDEAAKSFLPPHPSGRNCAEHSAPGEYNCTSDCGNSVAPDQNDDSSDDEAAGSAITPPVELVGAQELDAEPELGAVDLTTGDNDDPADAGGSHLEHGKLFGFQDLVPESAILAQVKSEGDLGNDAGDDTGAEDFTTAKKEEVSEDSSAAEGVKGEETAPCQQHAAGQKDFCRGSCVAGPIELGVISVADEADDASQDPAPVNGVRGPDDAETDADKALSLLPGHEGNRRVDAGEDADDGGGGEAGIRDGEESGVEAAGGENAGDDHKPGDRLKPGGAGDVEASGGDPGGGKMQKKRGKNTGAKAKKDSGSRDSDRKQGRPPTDNDDITVAVTPRARALALQFKSGHRCRMVSEAIIMYLEGGGQEVLSELKNLSLRLQQLIELLDSDDQTKGGQKWTLIGQASEVIAKLKKLLP